MGTTSPYFRETAVKKEEDGGASRSDSYPLVLVSSSALDTRNEVEETFSKVSEAWVLPLAGRRGSGARWPPSWTCPLLPQLIYDAGVSFMVIMFTWSGLACLIFLNCALNWPSEAFPAPEESSYT